MQDNIKNKVVVILFGLIIYGFFFLNLVAPDKKSSVSERRKLEQFPKVSLKAIVSGDFFKKFDSYSMDQFYQREKFRKLKIKTDMLVLGNYNNMQMDKDYIYLNGTSGLLKIDNLLENNGKRLIIFRDSYTSSLSPLLISGYKEIILVDTRYISPKILNNYINFKDADILFLYGAIMANNSYTIR